jgi:enoyl-CoA hydratase
VSDQSGKPLGTSNRVDQENSSILVEKADGIAVIRLNLPAQRNSLSIATLQELRKTLSSLLTLKELKAVIFTGTGDVFASGADIRELASLDSQAANEFALFGQSVFQMIEDARQLTIAAINGFCMGGGLDLALACDIRVASKTAVFAHPGAKRGIITGWGGTQRLPRIIGKSRALELFATARELTSGEALQFGLVSRLSDRVVDTALELARSHRLKRVSTDTIAT